MKKTHLLCSMFAVLSMNAQVLTAVPHTEAARERVSTTPTLYGYPDEETKTADKKDLHANLIQNGSFEEEAKPIRNQRFGPNGEGERFGGWPAPGTIPAWYTTNSKGAASNIEITTEGLLDETQHKALCWTITEATAATPAAIGNTGERNVLSLKGNNYTLTFWARADKRYKGSLYVGLQNKHDGTWHAKVKIKKKISKKWKKYTLTFTPNADDTQARFIMSANTPGTLYIDGVSLHH